MKCHDYFNISNPFSVSIKLSLYHNQWRVNVFYSVHKMDCCWWFEHRRARLKFFFIHSLRLNINTLCCFPTLWCYIFMIYSLLLNLCVSMQSPHKFFHSCLVQRWSPKQYSIFSEYQTSRRCMAVSNLSHRSHFRPCIFLIAVLLLSSKLRERSSVACSHPKKRLPVVLGRWMFVARWTALAQQTDIDWRMPVARRMGIAQRTAVSRRQCLQNLTNTMYIFNDTYICNTHVL